MDQEMTVSDLISLLQKEDPTKEVRIAVIERLKFNEYTVKKVVSGNGCVFLAQGHKII